MTTAVQGDFFGPRCALAVLADLFLGYALWAEIRGSEASRYFAETANRASSASEGHSS